MYGTYLPPTFGTVSNLAFGTAGYSYHSDLPREPKVYELVYSLLIRKMTFVNYTGF